jgi:hypothetical protein
LIVDLTIADLAIAVTINNRQSQSRLGNRKIRDRQSAFRNAF